MRGSLRRIFVSRRTIPIISFLQSILLITEIVTTWSVFLRVLSAWSLLVTFPTLALLLVVMSVITVASMNGCNRNQSALLAEGASKISGLAPSPSFSFLSSLERLTPKR